METFMIRIYNEMINVFIYLFILFHNFIKPKNINIDYNQYVCMYVMVVSLHVYVCVLAY